MALRDRVMFLTITVSLSTATAHGQSQLSGRVMSDSGKPIGNATITLTSVGYTIRTDSLGRFQLSGTPGSTLNLRLQATGFRSDTASVVLVRGRVITRDFTLVPETALVPEANPSDRMLRAGPRRSRGWNILRSRPDR